MAPLNSSVHSTTTTSIYDGQDDDTTQDDSSVEWGRDDKEDDEYEQTEALDKNNNDGSSKNYKQLYQKMSLQYKQMKIQHNQQQKRALELEQILNGYESYNDPQELILSKELELADANMTIQRLQNKVKELEQKSKQQSLTKLSSNTRQRSFRWPASSQNQQQSSRRNLMMQKSKSFRWGASTATATATRSGGSDDGNDGILKSLLVQLRNITDQKSTLEEKCKTYESTICSLRSKLRTRNEKKKEMINHSLHKKIMQSQVQALEEERNEFATKCELQQQIIVSMEEEKEKEMLTIKKEEQYQEQRREGNHETQELKQQQQTQTAKSNASDDVVDPLLVNVSLHRQLLQTQIDALEEERTYWKNKCSQKTSILNINSDNTGASVDSATAAAAAANKDSDKMIKSLQEDNQLLKLKIEMLEQMVIVSGS